MKNNPIQARIIKYGYRYMTHWDDAVLMRPHWRLFWTNKTGARLESNGQVLELGPDYLTILPPYSYVIHQFYESFDIFYLNAEISKPFHQYNKGIFQVRIDDEVRRLQNGPRRQVASRL